MCTMIGNISRIFLNHIFSRYTSEFVHLRKLTMNDSLQISLELVP